MARYRLGDHSYWHQRLGLIPALEKMTQEEIKVARQRELDGLPLEDVAPKGFKHREIEVPDDHVPSITWTPLDDAAKKAMAKRKERFAADQERLIENDRARDPREMMKELVAMRESNERVQGELLNRVKRSDKGAA